MRILNYTKFDLDVEITITLRGLLHFVNALFGIVHKSLIIRNRTDKDEAAPARLYWKVGDDQGTAYLTVTDDTRPLHLVADLVHEGLHGKVTIGDEETPIRIATDSIMSKLEL